MTGHVAWHFSTEQTMLATLDPFLKVDMLVLKKNCQSESSFTNKIDPAELNKLFHMSLMFFVRKNLTIVKGLDRDLKSFALTMVGMF